MIDRLDKQIIKELQDNGRQSYTQLARILGMSEGTMRKRVRDLESKGVMKIKAVIDPTNIGYRFVSVMGIEVKIADLRQVAEILAQKPNVYYLAFIAGRFDMVALILTKTPEELSVFIKEHISSIPSITRTETFVNLEVIKSPWMEGMDMTQLISGIV